ncbi:MAG: amidohydrolase family protein [Saccharofermentanales bacterium]
MDRIKMIIDFHTHAFPDDLAQKALSILVANARYTLAPVSDGTISGLVKNMDNWHIGISVVQPVITKHSHMKKTNEWASSISSKHVIAFGGIFPHTDDYKRDIDFVCDLGLKGLKFHAEYQNFVIDDDHMLKIYDYALSKGLIIMHHAGVDIGMPPPYKSSPKQFARIARAMQGGVIIAAHFGGHKQWNEVENELIGENIYLDTSMGFDYFTDEQFIRIVRNHGVEKILFASDSPWSSAEKEIIHINELPLTESEKSAILSDNARRLLHI